MKALLAHDDRVKLYGLARVLADDGIAVVGEAVTAEQIVPLVRRAQPTVVLLGYSFAASADWIVLRELVTGGAVKVFVLMPDRLNGSAADALEHGALGCISPETDPRDIPALLRQAVAGHFCCAPPDEPAVEARDELTEREWTVLDALARGLSNEAIGRELWVSSHTVKSHLHHIYVKLGVANRTEAARYAMEHGSTSGLARAGLS